MNGDVPAPGPAPTPSAQPAAPQAAPAAAPTQHAPETRTLDQRIEAHRAQAERINLKPPEGAEPEAKPADAEQPPEVKPAAPPQDPPEVQKLRAEFKATSEEAAALKAQTAEWESTAPALTGRISAQAEMITLLSSCLAEGRQPTDAEIMAIKDREALHIAKAELDALKAQQAKQTEEATKAQKKAQYDAVITQSKAVIAKHPQLAPWASPQAFQFWQMVQKNPQALALADAVAARLKPQAPAQQQPQQAPRTLRTSATGGGEPVVTDINSVRDKHMQRLRAAGRA
jgi:hypothetical protein